MLPWHLTRSRHTAGSSHVDSTCSKVSLARAEHSVELAADTRAWRWGLGSHVVPAPPPPGKLGREGRSPME